MLLLLLLNLSLLPLFETSTTLPCSWILPVCYRLSAVKSSIYSSVVSSSKPITSYYNRTCSNISSLTFVLVPAFSFSAFSTPGTSRSLSPRPELSITKTVNYYFLAVTLISPVGVSVCVTVPYFPMLVNESVEYLNVMWIWSIWRVNWIVTVSWEW